MQAQCAALSPGDVRHAVVPDPVRLAGRTVGDCTAEPARSPRPRPTNLNRWTNGPTADAGCRQQRAVSVAKYDAAGVDAHTTCPRLDNKRCNEDAERARFRRGPQARDNLSWPHPSRDGRPEHRVPLHALPTPNERLILARTPLCVLRARLDIFNGVLHCPRHCAPSSASIAALAWMCSSSST